MYGIILEQSTSLQMNILNHIILDLAASRNISDILPPEGEGA